MRVKEKLRSSIKEESRNFLVFPLRSRLPKLASQKTKSRNGKQRWKVSELVKGKNKWDQATIVCFLNQTRIKSEEIWMS